MKDVGGAADTSAIARLERDVSQIFPLGTNKFVILS
jgi:hypothetical protein